MKGAQSSQMFVCVCVGGNGVNGGGGHAPP